MSDGLLSEIKAQRRKNTLLLFVTLLISLPLFLILVGRTVEIQVHPAEAAAAANIEFIQGFGIPLQSQLYSRVKQTSWKSIQLCRE